MKLNEAVKHLDLEDCVYPFISIDEYEPKVGSEKDIIVLAFFCSEQLVAEDLKHFLSKSYVDVIDVDVSPNPDHKGRYVVFVELHREPSFFPKCRDLIKEVERLSGKLDWQVKPYLADQSFDIKDDSWKKAIITDPDKYMTKEEFERELETAIGDFFEKANVDRVAVKEGKLTIVSGMQQITFGFKGIVDETTAVHILEATSHENYRTTEVVKLDEMLHCAYQVYQTKDKILLHGGGDKVVILSRYH